MSQQPQQRTSDNDSKNHATSQPEQTSTNTNLNLSTDTPPTTSSNPNQHMKTEQGPNSSSQQIPKNTSAVNRTPPDKNDIDNDSDDDVVVFDAERARRLRGHAPLVPESVGDESDDESLKKPDDSETATAEAESKVDENLSQDANGAGSGSGGCKYECG